MAVALAIFVVFGYERLLAFVTNRGVQLDDEPDQLDKLDVALLESEPSDPDAQQARERLLKAPPSERVQRELDAVKAFRRAIILRWRSIKETKTLDDFRDQIASIAGWAPASSDTYFNRLTYLLDRFQSRINEEYTDISSRKAGLSQARRS